jgi:hypothetical protein
LGIDQPSHSRFAFPPIQEESKTDQNFMAGGVMVITGEINHAGTI